MIEVRCGQCGHTYNVKDELIGKQVRCKCGQTIRVETPLNEDGMPDFDSLFSALAEEERNAPTLADSMMGA
jgi:hypothetical protein